MSADRAAEFTIPAGEGAPRSPALEPRAPYMLSSDVVLSEDHFLVKLTKIDPARDTVVAYSRADGEVEAVLLQAEAQVVSQVYQDPAAVGGWNSRALPVPFGVANDGVTDMVAGSTGGVLHVWYRIGETVYWIVLPLAGTVKGVPSLKQKLAWPGTAGPLQISSNAAGNLLAYCVSESSGPDKTDAMLHYSYTAPMYSSGSSKGEYTAAGTLSGFEFHASSSDSSDYKFSGARCAAMMDSLDTVQVIGQGESVWSFGAVSLFAPTKEGIIAHCYATVQHAGEVNGQFSTEPLQPQPPVSFIESVDYLSAPTPTSLTAVVRTGQQALLLVTAEYPGPESWSGSLSKWTIQELPMPTLTAAQKQVTLPWQPATTPSTPADFKPPGPYNVMKVPTTLLELFVHAGDVTHVIRQVDQGDVDKNSRTPVFYPAVPLQAGVGTLASHPGPSTGNELIFAGTDGYLEYLARDPVTGIWHGSDIHLPATEPQQVSTYRVKLTLTDNWGAPVAGAPLSIAASSPASALCSNQAIRLGTTAATLTTGRDGAVVLALIATGTAAPKLTVSTPNLPAAAEIYPSAPVTTYMSGSGTLNTLPPMSADTLTNATVSGSTAPLAPGVQHNPDLAAKAVSVLNKAATAAPALSAPHAPQHAPRPGRQPAPPNQIQVGLLTLSLRELGDDIWHGVKTGASKVGSVIADEDVFTITLDFLEVPYNLTVKVIEDIGHVFHSIINWIGAEAEHFIDWLKAEVLAILTDAINVAKTFGDLLATDMPAFLLKQIDTGQSKADAWLRHLQTSIEDYFTEAAKKLKGGTLANGGKPPQPAPPRGQPGAPGGQTPDARSTGNSAHAKWLADKLRDLVAPQVVTELAWPADFQSKLDKLKSDLEKDAQTLFNGVEEAFKGIVDTLSNPKTILTTGLPEMIEAFGKVAAGGLGMLIDGIDVIFDLLRLMVELWQQCLTAALSELPLIGSLVKALDPSLGQLTIAQLGCLIFAFPFVVTWKITHPGIATPFTSPAAIPPRTPAKPKSVQVSAPMLATAQDGWNIGAGIATLVCGASDAFASTVAPSVRNPKPDDFPLCNYVDLTLPAVAAFCSFTGIGTSGKLNDNPPVTDTAGSVLNFVTWILGCLPPLVPAASIVLGKTTSTPLAPLRALSSNLGCMAYAWQGGLAMALGFAACVANVAEDRTPYPEVWIENFTGNIGNVANFLLIRPVIDSAVWGELGEIVCFALVLGGAVVTSTLQFIFEPSWRN